jgi:hypothetical protein
LLRLPFDDIYFIERDIQKPDLVLIGHPHLKP